MPRPDFFIVGAPRCGTTAMYDYLRQHPQVFMPVRKEPVYFGSDLTKRLPLLTEEDYLELFADAGDARRVGEATVWYLYSDTAPEEIAAFAPEARIIIMVRNPLDFIPSLHAMLVYAGNEDLVDLDDALAAEADRRAGRRMPPGTRRPEGLLYRERAKFAGHVERWRAVFGDRVMVIVHDDLRADAAGVYRDVLRFLDVDPGFTPAFDVVNANKAARSRRLQGLLTDARWIRATGRLPGRLGHRLNRVLQRANQRREERPGLTPATRRALADELRPSVDRLGQLLGRDLSGWLEDAA